jgi:hypothetical protein
MMRLSAAVTRRVLAADDVGVGAADAVGVAAGSGIVAPSFKVRVAATGCMAGVAERGGSSIERLGNPLARGDGDEGLTSSSQVNIYIYPMCEL